MDNRKAGKLPPAFGNGSMLTLPEHTGTERPNPLTTFKLFERRNTIGPSDSIPNADNRALSRSRKKVHRNENANEDSDHSTGNAAMQLPQLPADHILLQAISQVQLPMDGWETPNIFGLFAILVDPPLDLDLGAIEDLPDYLKQLQAKIGSRVENGVREIVCHCWWVLLSKPSTPNISRI